MNLAELYHYSLQRLSFSSTKEIDAVLLIKHIFGYSNTEIYTHPEKIIDDKLLPLLEHLLERRNKGEPIAYLLGQKDFWTLTLKVTPDVLVPRPETEHLVEYILERSNNHRELKLLELGTGSGAIALALASEHPTWQIDASDISKAALAIAEENAKSHHLENIKFSQGSWFEAFSGPRSWDVIVSNPPYLSLQDPHLVNLNTEPQHALISGENGLEAIYEIIHQARSYLSPAGYVVLEHGAEQGAAVREIFETFEYQNVLTLQDLAKRDRLTVGNI